ncbi:MULTISPECIES: phosphate-starvation-inducible PsiE family protein [Thioclava]|uniref:phosphate-starvation-inducible PsiE family protein n=1 Tax=Thioclava TaxID=285107 RepID=UPI002354A8BD|nr:MULTISPECIES: phosphate-starvation-inducible PsiE family protein [Thioclava]
MKQTETRPKVREDWSAMTLYERFEQAAIVVLTGIIMIIIVSALWQLIREVGLRLLLGGLDPLDYRTFQAVFGMIFTVVIALEFKRSLLVAVERRFGVVQARSIILIALLAIVRKFIILDLSETEASKIGALAATVLALGLVYWLVRDQDMRERAEAQDL